MRIKQHLSSFNALIQASPNFVNSYHVHFKKIRFISPFHRVFQRKVFVWLSLWDLSVAVGSQDIVRPVDLRRKI